MTSTDDQFAAPPAAGPHRLATTLAALVVLLIAAGALVKSKEAGLAVPDWPLSYGSLNPPRWWEIDNVRAEHGHRLMAGSVALVTVGLALWLGRRDPRRWVRRLGWVAVAAVLVQALLGGLTVLFFLPPAISIAHAGLAEIFLCLVVTLAVVTSAGWWRAGAAGAAPERADPGSTSPPAVRAPSPRGAGPLRLTPLAASVTGLVFLQILLGAVVRHFGAGLAIPDFPLAFGRLVPPRLDLPIALHFGHRVGALLVAAGVAALGISIVRRWRGVPPLARAAAALGLLVPAQIALGGAVVLTGRAVAPNTVHVAGGATILALCLVTALWAARLESRAAGMPVAGSRPAPQPLGDAGLGEKRGRAAVSGAGPAAARDGRGSPAAAAR